MKNVKTHTPNNEDKHPGRAKAAKNIGLTQTIILQKIDHNGFVFMSKSRKDFD
jgi:hypothetical protein